VSQKAARRLTRLRLAPQLRDTWTRRTATIMSLYQMLRSGFR
jgi:hypothetical protein